MNINKAIFGAVFQWNVLPTLVDLGVEHGWDSDSAGLRLLREAAGVCEEQRLLRVYQTSNWQIPYAGVWQVWWDCCKFKDGSVIYFVFSQIFASTVGHCYPIMSYNKTVVDVINLTQSFISGQQSSKQICDCFVHVCVI